MKLAFGELFHHPANLLFALLDAAALGVLSDHCRLAHRAFATSHVVTANSHATVGELAPGSRVVAGLGRVLETVHVTYLSCGLPPY